MMRAWRPSRVGIDGHIGPFACYLNEHRWNGWRCPVFAFEQLGAVIGGLPYTLSFEGETREVLETLAEDPDNEVVRIKAQTIFVNDRTLEVWTIGEGWCWEEA